MADRYQNRDWDELGRDIQDVIDRAVNSRNYQKLNQTISQIVDMAVGTGSEAVRRAREQNRQAYQNGKSAHVNGYNGRVVYTYTPNKPSEPKKYQPEESKNLPMLYGDTSGKTAGGIIKTIGGGLLTGSTSVGLGVMALLKAFAVGGSFLAAPMALMAAGLAGGVALLSSGIGSLSKLSRYKMYMKTLGTKTYCDLERLARSVGKNTRFVQKDLQKMISEGYFLQGHLDAERKSLITSDETYRHYQQARLEQAEQQRREKLEAQLRTAPKAVSPQVQEVLDRGRAYVNQIRVCNDAIPGEEISDKISHMEMIVQKIFDRAEAHPEIVPELKKLMDYYLPMTVKLLNAYAEMDRQPVQGETIRNSKREIEDTLDTLNNAFEKLLDSVFKETALDVSSDISVLQTLLAQEGLTDDEIHNIKKDYI